MNLEERVKKLELLLESNKEMSIDEIGIKVGKVIKDCKYRAMDEDMVLHMEAELLYEDIVSRLGLILGDKFRESIF